MKKVLTVATFAGILAMVACGQSAADKAVAEKKKQDSIKVADSIAAATSAANMAAESAKEAAKADSLAKIAKADSIAKAEEAAKKGGKKK